MHQLNKSDKIQNQLLYRICVVHPCCVCMDVFFVLFFCCLPMCVCVYLQAQGALRECRSIRPVFCAIPLYCAPLACDPDVIGVLAVCGITNQKLKSVTIV